jgi:hypothetical protein
MGQDKNITQNSHFKPWKYHTLVGNSYFERHQVMDSVEHYEIAICEAIMLIKMVHSGKAAVAALLASFYNLAELYTQQNEHALSENELIKAYNIINALLLNEQSEEQKEALRWGKSKANFALLQFRHLHQDSLSLNHQSQLNSVTKKQSN